MCLIVVAWRQHPKFPLLIAANRDEYHARPTRPSQFWPDHPQLLAGQDLSQGGTWMGVTRAGRFAAITNFRDPELTQAPANQAQQPRPSRGALPLSFLLSAMTPDLFLAELATQRQDYAGYNLLVSDGHTLACGGNAGPAAQRLAPGVYGLSNARLDTPWPKVQRAKAAMAQLLKSGQVSHESLANTVSNHTPAKAGELAALGLEGEFDSALSAQFIQAGAYGTRATTTLMLGADEGIFWRETSFDAAGEVCGEAEFET